MQKVITRSIFTDGIFMGMGYIFIYIGGGNNVRGGGPLGGKNVGGKKVVARCCCPAMVGCEGKRD